MEKKIIAYFLAAFLVLPCGCAKTPDEVKANMRQYNRNPGAVSEAQKQYGAASGLLDGEDAVLHAKYQNLTMPERISLQPVTSIPQVTFRQASGFEKSYRAVMSLFFDAATLAHQKIQYDEDKIWSNSEWFLNPSEKISATVCSNGIVLIRKKDAFDLLMNDVAYERVNLIHIDRGENTNAAYQLLDKKYSVADAVEYINRWMTEKWAPLEPGFTFRVKTVIVRKLDQKHFYYEITVEKLYKGIALDEIRDVQHKIDKNGPYFTCTQNFVSIEMMTSGTISSFNSSFGIYEIAKEDTSANRYVTLKSAADKVEEKLSGFKNIRISDIHLKYTLCPHYDNTVIYEDKAKTKGFTKQNTTSPGITVTSRPVYAFVIDVDPKEYEENGRIFQGDLRKYVTVDAVTGEMQIRMKYIKASP